VTDTPDLDLFLPTGPPHIVENINAIVGAAFRAANAKRARSQQKKLGMSELGGCRRQAGFKVLGFEPTNPHEARTDKYADSREAMIGTMIHETILPQIRAMSLTAEIEVPVVLQFDGLPEIPGSSDLIDASEGLILDLKTVGGYGADFVKSRGPSKKHLWQTHGYATAAIQSGIPINSIALVYLDRSDGQVVHVHYQDYDPHIVTDMEEWWREVTSTDDPFTLPRDEKGPGLSKMCDWCEWMSACWGPDATPGQKGVQKVVLDEVPPSQRRDEVEEFLRKYKEASDREKEALEEKKFAREVLVGAESGVYGSMILKWGNPSTYEQLDSGAAEAALTAAGLPVPKIERSRDARIDVKRAK
jgi:PD-(D/E)XK nuclease superfamily